MIGLLFLPRLREQVKKRPKDLEKPVDVTASPPLGKWKSPQLVRMGSVTSLTSKVDKKGRADGGKVSSNKYRT